MNILATLDHVAQATENTNRDLAIEIDCVAYAIGQIQKRRHKVTAYGLGGMSKKVASLAGELGGKKYDQGYTGESFTFKAPKVAMEFLSRVQKQFGKKLHASEAGPLGVVVSLASANANQISSLLDKISSSLEGEDDALAAQIDEVSEQLAAEDEADAAPKGHHWFDGKNWYADTAFMNSLSKGWPDGYNGMKHMGFGEFEIVLPDGTEIQFDRMRGKDIKEQSGRAHQLYDNRNGKAVEQMIKIMEKSRASEKMEMEATAKTVIASDWEDVAMAELAAKEDLDVDLMDSDSRYALGNGVMMSEGRQEYMVFEDSDDAEKAAEESVIQSFEDDPASYMDWLQNFMYVSPTDIRILSNEEADNYVEGIEDDYERLMDEADMERDWEKITDVEERLEGELSETDDPKVEKKIQSKLKKLSIAKEKAIDKAKEKLSERLAKQTARQLKDDPMGWAEDLGYDKGNLPNIFVIDYEEAAEKAVNADGVAHFLAGYDGNEIDLPSGALAYRNN